MLNPGNRVIDTPPHLKGRGNRYSALPVTTKSFNDAKVTGNTSYALCARAHARQLPVTLKAAIFAAAAELGFPEPKPAQVEAIEYLCEGRDVLVVAATGFGKSLVAQVMTKMRKALGLGLTLAVGPLIALAADQRRRAEECRLRTAAWNSKVNEADKQRILERIVTGDLDILFTTLESLRGRDLQYALLGNVGLVWFDEVHTSIRDKNFRPAQGNAGRIADSIRPQVRYACTATTALSEQRELLARAGLQNPHVIRLSAARENLSYVHAERNVYAVRNVLKTHPGERGIIYTATIRAAKGLAEELKAAGFNVAAYTGASTKVERDALQTAFTDRRIQVMVATDAFGLGVDLPDVRFIVTFDPASSVAAFFQQAGRAGRDGNPSHVYLCSQQASEGWSTRGWLVTTGFPLVDDLRKVWNFLRAAGPKGIAASQLEIVSDAGLPHAKHIAGSVFSALKRRDLVAEQQHAAREYTYFATGNFDAQDWAQYLGERQAALDALEQLKNIWKMPAPEIPAALAAHFDGIE